VAGQPVIIEAAINGVNPDGPRQPGEIADDALACLGAGAAIVHNHIDLVADGDTVAARYLEGWQPVLARRPDALLYPTVNGAADVMARFAHIPPLVRTAGLRIGLVDPGSVNLGPRYTYVNSGRDIEYEVELCAEHHLGPSMAIFEPGFLRAALTYWQAGRLPPGALIKLYFGGGAGYLDGGAPFGLPPTPASLDAYLAMLKGCGLPWSVAVIGGDVVGSGLASVALERGGHLHVGLEDYAGSRQPRNAELVAEAVALAAEVGRPVASCDEAAALLALPKPYPSTVTQSS
jgi:3-keto-5-aminohexanoate cleavage enzyme